MDFEVISDTRNELLCRREIRFILRYEGATPSRLQVIGKLCALHNVKEQQVVLDSQKTSFGRTELVGEARIYDTEEGRMKTERAYLMERGIPKKQEGAA
jgi:small subunit ribosomal protein S24e